MKTVLSAGLIGLGLVVSCRAGEETKMTITMKSTAFESQAKIPAQYTGEGKDISPSLSWESIPANAKSLAMICDDPDAPRDEPWVHWVIWNIPATAKGLPENVDKTASPKNVAGAMQGKNGSSKTGYNGPMPPKGHGVHHYHFKLYALDTTLTLAGDTTKKQLLETMNGHILAQGELIGTYERK